MKLFQYFKDKKKAKEIEELSKKFPLWNYGVRKYGYPCWEAYVLHMRLFTVQEIELIHEVILRKGREKYGSEPLFWSPEDWQNHIVIENGY